MAPNADVFLLGSGESILNLTDPEIEYINHAACRMALNKFVIFHKIARILPTHVFFVDSHDRACHQYIQRAFDVCRTDNLREITFILDESLGGNITPSRIWRLLRILRNAVERNPTPLLSCPPGRKTVFVSRTDWLKGGEWANSLSLPLFHYRGSLTSALNYLSITFPGTTIKLVGFDLNSGGYFFQREVEQLSIACETWATRASAEKGRHGTIVDYKGTNMLDKFDFVLESLRRTQNELLCCNRESLLVEKGIVPYHPIVHPDSEIRAAACRNHLVER